MIQLRVVLIACSCLLLAACGGASKQAEISRAAAVRLAGESDAVAASLRRGDSCGAVTRARRLGDDVEQAIADGSIPRPLAADASEAATRLASELACVPPPPPAAKRPGKEKKKREEHKKHEQKPKEHR